MDLASAANVSANAETVDHKQTDIQKRVAREGEDVRRSAKPQRSRGLVA